MLTFSGERIVPEADNCEPLFALKMYQEHIARYLFASQAARGKAVLDVGCGVGYGSQLLARNGATGVTAFDISESAIAHAREFYAHPNVQYLVSSAEEFSFHNKFDLVTCFELIEHLPHQHDAVKRLAAALSVEGMLVISTPRPMGRQQRSAFHIRELDFRDFSNLLACYFPYVEWFFENNHFASIVAGSAPEEISAIHKLHQQFSMGQADYFIAVASHSPIHREFFQAQLVLNNDAYVKNLERDVDVLHGAENDLKGRIEVLGLQAESLRAEYELSRTDAEKAKEALRLLEQAKAIQSEAERRAEPDLRGEVARLREELANARLQKAEQIRRSQARDRLVAQLKEELARAGAAIHQPLEELEQVRQRCVSMENESEQWRLSAWAAQGAVQTLEQQVEAICASRSWTITKPLRSLAFKLRRNRALHNCSAPSLNPGSPAPQNITAVSVTSVQGTPSAPSFAPETAESLNIGASLPGSNRREVDVIYVIGCHEGESKRYRAHNLANSLTRLGFWTEVMTDSEISEIIERHYLARVIVLFRCAYNDSVKRLLQYCRERGIISIFDIDDLVFEPESIGYVHVVNTFPSEDRTIYLHDVGRYRQTLLECDRVTCTTSYLAQRISALGKPVDVIPNSLNDSQEAVLRGLPQKVESAKELRIGYFSGSNTHQADFMACEGALLDLMQHYPQVRFVLVGILDLGPEWDRFADRIERHPILPYCEMLRVLSTIDVNLAPLEVGNPYCEGKSQLKIFEAGLVSVPTVASSTQSYREAIDDGIDGFVASMRTEWLSALKRLVDSEVLRRNVGIKAKERALKQFGPEPVARQAAQVYGFPVPPPQLLGDGKEERLKITWIIPGIIIGGGGHRNILRAAYHLEQFGHLLELYFTSTELDAYELKETVHTHFYPLQCPIHRYNGSISPTDVLFATHWSTVDAAVKARRSARELMYFVQDFEPAFAPMGTEYILAENTYRLGLYHITSGPWCEYFLKERFGCEADHFLFPVDRSIYHPRTRAKTTPNVLFFAKPEMPRRCYELGLMALERFHQLRPDVEIIMFGSAHLHNVTPPFPATILSIVPTLEDLAQLYTNANLGIVFSTTNPSLVPYEMMACGLPVVDLGRPGNQINYGGREDIAFLADPSPDAMARQIQDLLEDRQQLSARSKKGLEFVQQFPSEEQMARRVEDLILRRMGRLEAVGSVAVA